MPPWYIYRRERVQLQLMDPSQHQQYNNRNQMCHELELNNI